MFTEFKLGDTVKVWPRPGLSVQAHGNTPGRFLDAAGEEVVWSNWHYELARSGAIVLTDPSGEGGQGGHRLAAHDDGSAAQAALDAHQAELDAAKAKAEADKKAELEAAAAPKAAAPSSSAPAAPTAEAPASATKEHD